MEKSYNLSKTFDFNEDKMLVKIYYDEIIENIIISMLLSLDKLYISFFLY